MVTLVNMLIYCWVLHDVYSFSLVNKFALFLMNIAWAESVMSLIYGVDAVGFIKFCSPVTTDEPCGFPEKQFFIVLASCVKGDVWFVLIWVMLHVNSYDIIANFY